MKKLARRPTSAGRPKWTIELERLAQHDWSTSSDEERRSVSEIVHALAYAVASGPTKTRLLADLRCEAVRVMKEHRTHATECRALGFVSGGPVADTQSRTDEVVAMVSAARDQLDLCRRRALAPADTAFRVTMGILAVVSTGAPLVRARVDVPSILGKRDAAVKATRRVLENAEPGERDVDVIIGRARRAGIIGAVLTVLRVPATDRKRMLDDARKHLGKRGGGQKR